MSIIECFLRNYYLFIHNMKQVSHEYILIKIRTAEISVGSP